jgi:leader peptidase (prepilin peptidase)/N-methyltransferase
LADYTAAATAAEDALIVEAWRLGPLAFQPPDGFGLFVILAAPAIGLFVHDAAARWPELPRLWPGKSTTAPLRLRTVAFAAAIAICAALAAPGPIGVAGAVFGWTLLYLALIDLRTLSVPVLETAFLALAGILCTAVVGGVQAFAAHMLAAIAVGALFLGLAAIYRRLRGRDGLGSGDALIAAALGAWLGPEALAWTVAGAAGLALAFALATARTQGQRLAFAPALAAAGVLAWTTSAAIR